MLQYPGFAYVVVFTVPATGVGEMVRLIGPGKITNVQAACFGERPQEMLDMLLASDAKATVVYPPGR